MRASGSVLFNITIGGYERATGKLLAKELKNRSASADDFKLILDFSS